MTIRTLAAAVAAICLLGGAQAEAILPGLWEMHSDMKMPGQPDVSAQMAQLQKQMASLSPEARKLVERQMASMGVGLGDKGAVRMCFGAEQARQPIREGHRDGACTYTQVSQAGNVWRGRMVCTHPKSEGEFTTTLHDPSHFTTQAVLQSAQGQVTMRTEARRLSPDCGALKPMSQKATPLAARVRG